MSYDSGRDLEEIWKRSGRDQEEIRKRSGRDQEEIRKRSGITWKDLEPSVLESSIKDYLKRFIDNKGS